MKRILLVGAVTAVWVAGCAPAQQPYKIIRADQVKQPEPYATAVDSNEVKEKSEPTLTGLERTNWEPVTIGPNRGIVSHYPRYFTRTDVFGNTWQAGADRPSSLTSDGAVDKQIDRATAGARRRFLDESDWKDTGLSIVKVGHDLIVMPYLLVQDPPGEVHHSPRRD